jgi:hypothetical protein
MKYLFTLITTLFLGSCSSVNNSIVQNKMEIYILMGQSNMAGRGLLTTENMSLANSKVKVLSENLLWVEAHHPLHFDKPSVCGVGPGLSFGMVMANSSPKIDIGLVPTAVGGTPIDHWVPGVKDKATGKYPYDDAEKRIKEAMKYGEIRGIIWHQGESDSEAEKLALYLPKLKKLIERVRELVGNEKLPFISGELGQFNDKFKNFNADIHKITEQVPFTAVVSSKDLTDKGDNLHFDSESAQILGERYAESMIKLQKKKR